MFGITTPPPAGSNCIGPEGFRASSLAFAIGLQQQGLVT
ncbi:hypothetical protein SynA1544_02457 [Synechococcus sp. A15-44]|nr:hypothetical protein SynA1544_02457 [Synechococcus sp. A15-44]